MSLIETLLGKFGYVKLSTIELPPQAAPNQPMHTHAQPPPLPHDVKQRAKNAAECPAAKRSIAGFAIRRVRMDVAARRRTGSN